MDKMCFGKQQFVGKTQGSITDHYQIIKEIGAGTYGRVYRVKKLTTGDLRACKQVVKAKISNMSQFTIEINTMTQMDHPNIIKLYEIFEDNRYIYLIMEECSGGELFTRIINKVKDNKLFTEKEAAIIFKNMMSAICHCHASGICHRDLKPENLLFLDTTDDSSLKVIDFGLSKYFKKEDNKMMTKVGTAYYLSPEVLTGDYDEKCDIWSAGVILYILLSGDPPFNGANDNEIFRKIRNKKFSFPSPMWDTISDDVKDLIQKMLCDAKDRLTAEEVLNHHWVKDLALNSQDVILNLKTETLKMYKNINNFQKAVRTFVASRLKYEEIKGLQEIFQALDQNQDGMLSVEEIKEGLSKLQQENTIDVEEIFQSIDTDGSGVINYTEFLAATIEEKIYLKEERLYEAFKAFDKDDSGKISIEEIKNIIKVEDTEKLEEIVKKFDINGDGEIDYNEFIIMMSSKLEI